MILAHAMAAALLLTLAFYAHYRIPFHTAGKNKVLLVRSVLG